MPGTPTALDLATEQVKSARNLAATAETEGRDLTDSENRQILDSVAALKNARADAARARQRALVGSALDAAAADSVAADEVIDPPAKASRSFVDSEQYTAWKTAYPNAATGNPPVNIPPVHVGGLDGFRGGAKAATIMGGGANGLATGTDAGPVGIAGFAPLNLRNLYTTATTASDAVEYAQLQSASMAPAVVAEVTDPATTGLKPDSALAWTKVNAPVVTVATGLAVTKRALSDVGQVRTLLETFLESAVDAAIEDQTINGPGGAGDYIRGILATTGVQTQAFDTNIFTSIRKGITKVRKIAQGAGNLPLGMYPTGVVVSVEDDETIDLAQDTTDRYFGAGPFNAGPPTLWGLPRVATPFLAAGTAIVGDFRVCILWDREQASVSASDSHKDFFMRNLVQLLGEARVAFGILVPMGLVIVDVSAAA